MPKHTKRELILKSAIEIFCDNGFESTKIEDVAKKAGIGKSTVYEYFKSKDELFNECLLVMLKYYIDGFNLILSQDITFKQKIHDCLAHTKELFLKSSIGINSLHKSASKELLFMHEVLEKKGEYINAQLIKTIEIAMKKQEIRSDIKKEVLASMIRSTVLQVVMTCINDIFENEVFIDEIVDILCKGIEKNKT